MYKIGRYIIFILLFVSCKNKTIPRQKQEILALREMNELATAEYSITKVVKANDNQTWFKFGRRKILLACQASIKAGIDLSAIKEDNITIREKDITLYLPHAKIITLNIPPENIKVEHQDIGFWRDHFTNEEQNALMMQAEQSIRMAADSLGILKSAEDNARSFITAFLKRLGYSNASVEFDDKPKTKKLG